MILKICVSSYEILFIGVSSSSSFARQEHHRLELPLFRSDRTLTAPFNLRSELITIKEHGDSSYADAAAAAAQSLLAQSVLRRFLMLSILEG
mmetsp:Transcript_42675/g.68751  ORF Transcript_42675/g.68751 Transcript_42675/m.68751 type:complete len:92 (-) Transcript_42675:554-829(-)